MKTITYGSVCSGIEAASAAWDFFGWQPAWFSEIEPFPSAVLSHHYPHVANMGDMTHLPMLVRAGLVEAPDVLVGGTPCQAFSVAGVRGGLSDPRGQLTLSFADLANAIDEKRPGNECVVFWENVPGVLSSRDNAFGCFLGLLAGEDSELTPEPQPAPGKNSKYWKWDKNENSFACRWPNVGCVYGPQRTIAWRVLDAQYFGVAQRRRRVFVVASGRHGFDPAKLLFESDGVCRDTPPRRETGQDVTLPIAPCLRVRSNASHRLDTDAYIAVMVHGQAGAEISVGLRPTLTCNHEAPICVHGTQDPIVSNDQAHTLGRNRGQENAVVYSLQGSMFNRSENAGPLRPGVDDSGVSYTLTKTDVHGVAHGWNGDITPKAMSEIAPTMRADQGGEGYSVQHGAVVRRLTPRECERLQGFPDDYTLVPYRGKPAADGSRYKALGNSMAVPCMRWLAMRLIVTHTHLFI